MKKLFLLLLSAVPCFARAQQKKDTSLQLLSPDKTISISLSAKAEHFSYSVHIDGKPVVSTSALGLVLQNNLAAGRNVQLLRASRRSNNTTWKNPLGKSGTVRDEYNELYLQLQERSAGNLRFDVVFRAFNDGIAFRYVLPRQASLDSFTVVSELTQFNFSGDYSCYYGHHPSNGFRGSQEWEFEPHHLGDAQPDSIIGLPLLVNTNAAWIAVAEADLLDWSGMWLSKSPDKTAGNNTTFVARLAPRADKQGLVRANAPHNSPWRVLMIGRQPGQLVESNIIVNLATPSKIGDASWIQPGIMAWDHWWSGDVLMNTATLKQYIQLASDMSWPYQLIDWQWYGKYNSDTADITKVNPAVDMDEVRRFAKEKKVRLWVWLYWTDVDRNDAYKKAFALYEQWGLAGIKIDFMDRDDQDIVNWYEKIAKAAADHHLMLDFHGAFKPTGLERTYPNQITREGILGNEYNRWSRRVTSEHKLTLPFTRLLTGPADFTPGGFQNRQPSAFQPSAASAEVQGTRCAELALFVVYNSPVCVACDHPDHYRGQPGADFLQIVPTVWDETHVLLGQVADYIVEARRKGDSWFIGAMTDSTPRQLTVPLNFLGKGKYAITIWKDAGNAEQLEKEERTVTNADKLVIPMSSNGGYVARLQKQ